MLEKQQKRSRADLQMASALAVWEDEGGSSWAFPAAASDRIDGLAGPERHVLECLGAAVVLAWNELPMNVQRAVFRHASAVNEAHDPTQLRARIARFLHDHKDDASAS